MMKLFFIHLICCISIFANAQETKKIKPEEYINMYKDIAISEMKRSGVPATITLAQGILESENGNSILAKKSNNHFGIKCKTDWDGPKTYADDDARGECFRVYSSIADSYKDHSDFLKINPRYRFLFDLEKTDYKAWCYGLKQAGYATNPKYPELLISCVEKYNLQQYSLSENPVIINQNAEVNLETKPKENIKPIINNQIATAKKTNIIYDKQTVQGRTQVFVNKGISLLVIAEKLNVKINKLLKYNIGLSDGLLQEDKWIFIEK